MKKVTKKVTKKVAKTKSQESVLKEQQKLGLLMINEIRDLVDIYLEKGLSLKHIYVVLSIYLRNLIEITEKENL